MKKTALLALLALACSKGPVAPLPYAGSKLYVLAGGSETVDVLQTETGEVVLDAMPTGTAPSSVLVSGNTAYIVNSGFNGSPSLQVVSLSNDVVQREFPLPAGCGAYGAALVGTKVVVSARAHDALYLVDPLDGSVDDTVGVGKSPEGLARVGDYLFVACSGFDDSSFTYLPGTVWVLDTLLNPVDSVSVPDNPQELVVAPDGSLYCLSTGDFAVTYGVVTRLGTVPPFSVADSVATGGRPFYFAATADGRLFVAGDLTAEWGQWSVRELTASPLAVTDSFRVGANSAGDAEGDTGDVYVALNSWAGMNYVVRIGATVDSFALADAHGAGAVAFVP